MRYAIFAGAILAFGATPGFAEDFGGAVGCSPDRSARAATFDVPERLWDGAIYLAHNDFGGVGQDVGSAAVTYSFCDRNYRSRIRFEGNFALVDEGPNQSQSALIGIGYQFALGDRASITPTLRVGYASFDTTADQVAAGASVTLAGSKLLGSDNGGPWFTYEVVPEYTSWQSADAVLQGFDFNDGNFSNFTAVGVDFPLAGAYRARARIGHRYIDSDGPVTSITSAILSLRRDPLPETPCGAGCWSIDLWLSKGDGDYESVLIGLSRPFGR